MEQNPVGNTEPKKRGRPKSNKPVAPKEPRKKGRPKKPRPPKPKSTLNKPLPIFLDNDGNQHCPECMGSKLQITEDGNNVSVEIIEDKPWYRFVKQCKDCETYCFIVKRV